MADGVRNTIIAVEFDDCLCENTWLEIGESKQEIINELLERQAMDVKVILWTCRVEQHLGATVRWYAG